MTTFDNELKLINHLAWTEDAIGNQIPVTSETVLFCGLKSVGRNEFYNAAVAGLKPEISFIIKNYEYDGQTELIFEGVTYKVVRTYATGIEDLELICEKTLVEKTTVKLIDTQLVQALIAIIEEFVADEAVTMSEDTVDYYEAALAAAIAGY